jgi:uncharacterized protein YeaO (DUF488 family)
MADDRVAILVRERRVLSGEREHKGAAAQAVRTTGARAVPRRNQAVKRAYEAAKPEDGQRILVDRLWPRGVTKAQAKLDDWLKDIAPSARLRKWFGHDPARWDEFRRRYREELKQHGPLLRELRRQARKGPITLVYAAKDEAHNEAVVLRNVILGRSPSRRSTS